MLAKSSVWQYELAERGIALPVSRPKAKEGATNNRMAASAAAVLVLLALFVLYGANIFISQKEYEVQEVRTRVVELAKMNEVLRLEVGQLKSPGRIQQIAETELGMIIPTQAVYSSAKASTVVARSVTPSDKIRD
ncbi:MAG: hypothetical protein KH813_01490 [Negativicoccus succinicivorans]|uniref:hypothetical protein n=1 Tax=Negativicoccus succinicivorans TaxID=620903 RepID=UPI0026ED1F42|nr:hypothetical protein [Negativicoccus succinicivorans]MBS6028081.1 hypothetical protein [Negativicoccus succinicivorans]